MGLFCTCSDANDCKLSEFGFGTQFELCRECYALQTSKPDVMQMKAIHQQIIDNSSHNDIQYIILYIAFAFVVGMTVGYLIHCFGSYWKDIRTRFNI
uniref:Uncharacterized protein n=1 Tax=Acrobeloides nanus TaxID=290746 RepID=A0A914D8P1_9BILA